MKGENILICVDEELKGEAKKKKHGKRGMSEIS